MTSTEKREADRRWIRAALVAGGAAALALVGIDLLLHLVNEDPHAATGEFSFYAFLIHEKKLILGAGAVVLIGGALLVPLALASRELAQRTDVFRSLVGILDHGEAMLAIDTDGIVIYWNKPMERLSGRSAEEMLGKGDYEYAIPFYGERRPVLIDLALHWNDALKQKYLYVDFLPDGTLYAASYHPDLKGGIHCVTSAQKMLDEKGNVIGAMEIVRTVSERQASGGQWDENSGIQVSAERLAASEGIGGLVSDGVIYFDERRTILSANPAAVKMFGYESERIIGKSLDELIDLDLDDPSLIGRRYECEGYRRNGERLPVEVLVIRASSDLGPSYIVTLRDLSPQREGERKIRELRDMMNLEVLDQIPVGVSVYDSERRFVWGNKAYQEFYQMPDALMVSGTRGVEHVRHLIKIGLYGEGDPEELEAAALERFAKAEGLLKDFTLPDGTIIEMRHVPLMSGGRAILHTDVSVFRAQERKLAETDPLTGLPGPSIGTRQILALFQSSQQTNTEVLGLRLQLRRLASYEAAYGQGLTNQFLRRVIQRLQPLIDENYVFARGGTMDFVICAPTEDAFALGQTLSAALLKALGSPILLQEGSETVSLTPAVSVGMVRYPADDTDFEEWAKKGYLALEAAAAQVGNQACFYHEQDRTPWGERARENLKLAEDLESALASDQFFLQYQPQVHLDTQQVYGCEALMRWTHPTLGSIPPDRFIPIAEIGRAHV